jgi:uncharacterized protein YqhQ
MRNKLNIGGQAVIEGVMMRSPNYLATSIWKNNKIISKKEKIKQKNKFFRLFFIRGIVNLLEMLYYGIKTLIWSANQFESKKEKLSNKELFLTILASILFAVTLFIILPLYLAKIITNNNGVIFNIIDGLIRILFFLIYLIAISFIKDVKRLFEYHGAEHKVVNCYEADEKLNIKNIKKHSKLHLRCGTSFILIVLIISILVFSLITTDLWYKKLFLRIALLPVIAGISYEILKLSSRFKNNFIIKILIYPGLLLQRLTTKNPNKKQILAALNSFNTVIELEREEE